MPLLGGRKMATLNVPGTFATIQAAVNAASPGDVIVVNAGYGGPETVVVTVDNLIFDAPASITGVVLDISGLTDPTITLTDAAPFAVVGSAGDDKITGNNGVNYLIGGTGNDVISGGGGND